MNKPLVIILFVNLFFIQFAQSQFHLSEKKVTKNSISKNIVNYVEKNYKGKSAKYYKLITDNDSTFFEAKIKLDKRKINLIFDQNGEFIRVDNTVHFLEISEDIRKVIGKHLAEEVPAYRVTHCKNQRMVGQKTYELDVKAKKKNYKFRFKSDGTLIDYKIIPEETLIFIFH